MASTMLFAGNVRCNGQVVASAARRAPLGGLKPLRRLVKANVAAPLPAVEEAPVVAPEPRFEVGCQLHTVYPYLACSGGVQTSGLA